MDEARQSTVLDPGLQHLGTVYAKALLGATEKAGNTDQVLGELDALVRDVLDRSPQLEALLASPRVPLESKEGLLDRAFRDKVSMQLLNFLKVLVRHGRFESLRAVNVAIRKQFNDLRGRIEVRLTTAAPIDQTTSDMIVAKLRASLGHEIELQTNVDPELIGGLVIRIGDTVYDGSLANQLQRLSEDLVSRATRKMRTDGERFAVAN
jgi:F-type H+-transporting ATPase subunit delta